MSRYRKLLAGEARDDSEYAGEHLHPTAEHHEERGFPRVGNVTGKREGFLLTGKQHPLIGVALSIRLQSEPEPDRPAERQSEADDSNEERRELHAAHPIATETRQR